MIPNRSCQSAPRTTACLIVAVILGLALGACSSVKTHVDEGKVNAHTFSFLDTASRQLPSYADSSQQAHAMIQQAIIHNLAARGITHLPSGGDITVAYLVIVGNNTTTTSLNQYFGYTDDANALVNQVHKEQTGENNRGYFEAGTLVIDILQPHNSKLLQRRSIQAEVLRNLPTEQRTARIQALVDRALGDVPLSP
jgi:hypothetical protein